MDRIKLAGYLNIAHKGNYLIIGGEKLSNYDKKIFLVLYDNNIKKNTKKILDMLILKNILSFQVDNLEQLIHIKNCKIIGIKNKGLSDIIKKIMEN